MKKQKTKINYEYADIDSIFVNPKNPRVIKDAKFKALVKSVKDFPEMLEIRPVVIDENRIILGGEKRFLASKEAGLKQIPIVLAANLTEAQKKEFIIKDNVHAGEWDEDALVANFNSMDLEEWGVSSAMNFKGLTKSEKKQLKPFKKVHVLLSFHPDQFAKIQDKLNEIKKIKGIEYEQSAN